MCISHSRPCHFMHALHFIHSVKKELIKMFLVIRVTSIRILFGGWPGIRVENHSDFGPPTC